MIDLPLLKNKGESHPKIDFYTVLKQRKVLENARKIQKKWACLDDNRGTRL
jgi:hypothetical protein